MRKPDSSKINAKVAALILLLIVLGVTQASAFQAQTRNGPVTVASISSRPSANGTVVSIAADGPLNRAQTWPDREGYHVVVPSAATQNAIKPARGIKIRQLDRTLEIVIQPKPGANVTVQPTGNRLNLSVEGKLDSGASRQETDKVNSSSTPQQSEENADSGRQSTVSNATWAGRATAADQQMLAANSSAAARQSSYGFIAEAANVSEPAQ